MRKALAAAALAMVILGSPAHAQPELTGAAAYGDWRSDAPGVRRRITDADLRAPFSVPSSSNSPDVVARPAGALPRVPAGFAASLWASGLDMPRNLRTASNGDVMLAESGAGRVRVFRPGANGEAGTSTVFASGLNQPFGLAFWPPGPNPQFLYVAETNRIVRFGYHAGATKADGSPETVVPRLPDGGHWTRDIIAAPDGSRLYVSVGSASDHAASVGGLAEAERASFEASHGVGAPWGPELGRAQVFTLDPSGGGLRPYATGLRNCVGLATQANETPWCVTNERDGLGDDLPPDYATRLRPGAFFGWPWFYIGAHEDPRHRGQRPDLAGRVSVPDVLLQPHSAPLGIVFYEGTQFPSAYRGDAFVALHGSWNRSKRTGYKVVRLLMRDGKPTGAYEDFMTGFVASEDAVWGRPVGVTVMRDGSLLVSEDGNGTIWRVSATH